MQLITYRTRTTPANPAGAVPQRPPHCAPVSAGSLVLLRLAALIQVVGHVIALSAHLRGASKPKAQAGHSQQHVGSDGSS